MGDDEKHPPHNPRDPRVRLPPPESPHQRTQRRTEAVAHRGSNATDSTLQNRGARQHRRRLGQAEERHREREPGQTQPASHHPSSSVPSGRVLRCGLDPKAVIDPPALLGSAGRMSRLRGTVIAASPPVP